MKRIPVAGNTDCLIGRTAIGLYRLGGGRCILIDNGDSSEYDALTAFLREEHLTPAGLIVSHAHLDHHGNSKRLREEFGIPLAMASGEAALISSKAALDRYTNYFGRSPEEQYSIDYLQMCPVDVSIGPEQTEFTLCGVPFPVYHLPGHSFDHIAVVTPDGVCFGGDVLLTDHALSYVKLPYCDHVGLDLESKEQIARLPFQHWIFSHRGIVDGNLAELSEKNCALIRRRLAELAALLETPMNRDQFYGACRRLLDMHCKSTDQLVRQERHLRPYLEQLVMDGTAVLEIGDHTVLFKHA